MKVKRTAAAVAAGVILAVSTVVMTSAVKADSNIRYEGKTAIVSTAEIAKNVRGFRGTTPVEIYIKKGKIEKIVPLRNQETPKFFAKARTLLNNYTGKSVSKAARMQVDGVSGATFSSKALKKNVELGLAYYKKHRK